MNSKILSEAMGELDTRYIDEAVNYKKKAKRVWVRWGAAAACLCLVAVGGVIISQRNFPAPGGVSIPGDDTIGGGFTGGNVIGDSNIGSFSIAVYPPAESEKNVAKADAVSFTESEALANPLGKHLPKQFPEGFHYGRSSLYTTVMKNGTEYNMLRVEYLTGEFPEQKFSEDGGAIAPEPGIFGDVFMVCVYDHTPRTDDHIYSSAEEVSLPIFEEKRSAFIQVGECYVSVFADTADPSAVFEVLDNIG